MRVRVVPIRWPCVSHVRARDVGGTGANLRSGVSIGSGGQDREGQKQKQWKPETTAPTLYFALLRAHAALEPLYFLAWMFTSPLQSRPGRRLTFMNKSNAHTPSTMIPAARATRTIELDEYVYPSPAFVAVS